MRRVSEWGLKKNVQRKERRAILESLSSEANKVEFETRMIRGRKLDKAKIERWRKREGIGCGDSKTGVTGFALAPGRLPFLGVDHLQIADKKH
jgi:hypothetical protein